MTLSSLERLKLESYLSNKRVQRDDRIRAQALLPKLPTEGTLETWGRLFSCAAEIGIKDSLIILHYALQNGLVHKQCTEGPLIQRDAILDWLNLDNNLPAIWRCYCSSYQGEPAPLPQSEPNNKPEPGAAESRKRKRVDALAEAIEAALAVLSPDGKLPTPVALFEYLRTQDKTGVVTPGDSKMVFYWTASNGNKQSADISTIAERLDRMKRGD